MVKLILLNGDHLVASAPVVAVTLNARLGKFGMNPLLVIYLLLKLLMAGETVAVRKPSAESVAFGAVCDALIFRVSAGEFPGAYKRIHPLNRPGV